MKIKLLPIITGLLLSAGAMSSCLNSDTPDYELYSDATIHSFKIDTVYGETAFFSIDNARGLIFNQDSLKVGADTIINKIRITEIGVQGASVKHNDEYINLNDSVDLTEPYEMVTQSLYGDHTKTYTVHVNVAKHDPDSILWKEIANEIPLADNKTSKVISNIGGRIFVYTKDGKGYQLDSHKSNWQTITPTGLVLNEQDTITSILKDDKLYMLAGNNLYNSENGVNWTSMPADIEIENILSIYKNHLFAVANTTPRKFYTLDLQNNQWVAGEDVPSNFIDGKISSGYNQGQLATNSYSAIMGLNSHESKNLYAWMSTTGEDWQKLSDGSSKLACPLFLDVTMFSYDNQLYLFGQEEIEIKVEEEEETEEGKDTTEEDEEVPTIKVKEYKIFQSVDGINWKYASKKEQLPKEMYDRGIESVTIDTNNNIWFVCTGEGKVWRGRLNRFLAKN